MLSIVFVFAVMCFSTLGTPKANDKQAKHNDTHFYFPIVCSIRIVWILYFAYTSNTFYLSLSLSLNIGYSVFQIMTITLSLLFLFFLFIYFFFRDSLLDRNVCGGLSPPSGHSQMTTSLYQL